MGNGLIALTYLVKGLQLSTRQHNTQFREGKNKDEGGEEQKEEYHRDCTEQNFHTWKCCVCPGVNTFPCTLLILSVLLPESLSGSQENTLLTYTTIMESGGAPLWGLSHGSWKTMTQLCKPLYMCICVGASLSVSFSPSLCMCLCTCLPVPFLRSHPPVIFRQGPHGNLGFTDRAILASQWASGICLSSSS